MLGIINKSIYCQKKYLRELFNVEYELTINRCKGYVYTYRLHQNEEVSWAAEVRAKRRNHMHICTYKPAYRCRFSYDLNRPRSNIRTLTNQFLLWTNRHLKALI